MGEVALSQYEADPQELQLRELESEIIDKIEELEAHQDTIREAWDAWQDFNRLFHALSPSPEIVAAWDRIAPFLREQAQDSMVQLEYWREKQADIIWRF